MENMYIIDPANLEEHVMPNSTLLMLFMIFLCAHGLFIAFPAQPNATIFDGLINMDEVVSLLSLTLGLVAACIVRWSARVAPAGNEAKVLQDAATQRMIIIGLISFGSGGIFSHIMRMDMPLDTVPFALFGTLFGFIVFVVLGMISGQRALKPRA